ncbi:Short-chain dehydrogenase/reductase family 16C member 6 [Apostichopus japonicus]|uniref:Short-chain dehydrogenase/reductase 3 n=1 Tax=Stichopus japonicus TaxID=307972 RepID=A0A2G8LJ51_STIJA|nr:Short-chain dehydrogenase/reductase family 16C member 6 [Apostichopus japonicus]
MDITDIILAPFGLVLTLFLMLLYAIKGLIIFLIPTFLWPRKDVSNDVVLVTGGGCGFGRLFALEFSKLGSTIVIWDVNLNSAKDVAKECKSLGGRAFAFKVDVSKSEEVYKVADDVKKQVGDVTILINNAGVVAGTTLLEMPDHLIHRTFDINVKSFFWTIKAFAPSILENNHGHFVSVASLAGYFGGVRQTEYSASKFAVVGFEESMFMEFELHKNSGVHSTIIHPFYMNTGMFKGVESTKGLLPVLDPNQVMDKCMAAILTNQRYVFIPGTARLNIYLKSFMPPDVLRLSNNFLKIDDYMKGFIGRNKQQ